MTIDIARLLIAAALRASGELSALIPVLKDRCEPDEYRGYLLEIAAAIDAVQAPLINKALVAYPDLARGIEENIARTGRAFPDL